MEQDVRGQGDYSVPDAAPSPPELQHSDRQPCELFSFYYFIYFQFLLLLPFRDCLRAVVVVEFPS